MSTLNIVDASIATLQAALSSHSITSVSLVSLYLLRIAAYDTRGPTLNSIIFLNPDVFAEAAASDARRLAGKGLGPLDGIPYTVKDSYKVKNLTVASGSEAFRDLVATEDAFTVRKLREAGAVLIGKTNMPPSKGFLTPLFFQTKLMPFSGSWRHATRRLRSCRVSLQWQLPPSSLRIWLLKRLCSFNSFLFLCLRYG